MIDEDEDTEVLRPVDESLEWCAANGFYVDKRDHRTYCDSCDADREPYNGEE